MTQKVLRGVGYVLMPYVVWIWAVGITERELNLQKMAFFQWFLVPAVAAFAIFAVASQPRYAWYRYLPMIGITWFVVTMAIHIGLHTENDGVRAALWGAFTAIGSGGALFVCQPASALANRVAYGGIVVFTLILYRGGYPGSLAWPTVLIAAPLVSLMLGELHCILIGARPGLGRSRLIMLVS